MVILPRVILKGSHPYFSFRAEEFVVEKSLFVTRARRVFIIEEDNMNRQVFGYDVPATNPSNDLLQPTLLRKPPPPPVR
jgi:hypothetical protein